MRYRASAVARSRPAQILASIAFLGICAGEAFLDQHLDVRQLRSQHASEAAVGPIADHPPATHHAVAHRPGEPFPSWVPMAVAGGAGMVILFVGAAGAVLLFRRHSPDDHDEAELALFEDPELLALVKAHDEADSLQARRP